MCENETFIPLGRVLILLHFKILGTPTVELMFNVLRKHAEDFTKKKSIEQHDTDFFRIKLHEECRHKMQINYCTSMNDRSDSIG